MKRKPKKMIRTLSRVANLNMYLNIYYIDKKYFIADI